MSLTFLLILVACTFANQDHETQFLYNGFHGSTNKLNLDGLATILPNGLLQLTNSTPQNTSHAFYPHSITFKPNHTSFSTTFIFAITPQVPNHSGNGMAFVISPTTNFQHALSSFYLGLFNDSSNTLKPNHTIESSHHIFAVELDTVKNSVVQDIDNNHVGIDINSLISVSSTSASYYSDKESVNKSLQLNCGKPMQIWIDYDKVEMLINVTLAPFGFPKPSKCLLSYYFNLSDVFLDSMYVGFSAATGISSNSHYVLGWSWNQSGKARGFELSKLPSLPRIKHKLSSSQLIFVFLLSVVLLLLVMIVSTVWFYWRKRFEELLEPWEKVYAPHRFSYKDLYVATKGFKNSELLGVGGFGKVYKGVLPHRNVTRVAVKRISHDSRQGMKEFVAEISSMSRLRHRNLVQLLGYCRRKGELILVYEYMPNGSLDKFLFSNEEHLVLSWSLRFKVIKGVASALLYLHEGWEQVVLHRDVKAGNVLLDAEMNAKLGDFGLARLYDHENDPRTTHVVGTIGYIAPELSRTLKPSTMSDVYAFGMFLLEVCCGRRPIRKQDGNVLRKQDGNDADDLFLSDWVCDCWKRGQILRASDPKIAGHYQEDEMELVLKLGLLCIDPKAESRPTMRQVVQFLDGSVTPPDLPSGYDIDSISYFGIALRGSSSSSFPSSSGTGSSGLMSSLNSVLQSGR